MAYYIGVDGGGTKTAVALFDEEKNCLAVKTGPGSNHEGLDGSFPQAANIIADIIDKLLKQQNVDFSEIEYILMGLAGIDHQFQHDAMMEEFKKLGFANLSIYNDGFIVVKAGATGSAAIGYNCGTGTCCNGIDSKGNMMQVAGIGQYTGDSGNGGWIAAEVYRAVYDDVFLGLDKTVLSIMYYKEFNIDSRAEFLATVSSVYENCPPERAKALNEMLFKAAEMGDKAANKIVDYMALRGAQMITAIARELNFESEPIEVILSGSIHTKAESGIYTDRLKERAKERFSRPLKFIKLEQPPVVGCINWIFDILNKNK